MGHREDLLEGAKRCLIEKGYGRTTTRDIVAASGANLASIGYHYGSKEALLNAALLEALDDTGGEYQPTSVEDPRPGADPLERFEAAWGQIVEKYATRRQLLLASFEVFAQVDRVPELRAALADGIQQGRESMAELFQSIAGESAEPLDAERQNAIGSFYQALATGVMAQLLVDPDRAPSARDLTLALRTMVNWHTALLPEPQPAQI
ncbi:TetR/AcrR family transcriptional regulator [Kitasatospora sp. NPDC101801]|uniref:TetR/AcrR family transcriptional regulator n=1 Tax=unclassified Kitasatospora TaxID=2633591 RepID=UPI00325611D9